MEHNYKMTVCYDGTRYLGWEHQPGTNMTIQGKIENVMSRMLEIPVSRIDLIASGRTDAGVHARGQVCSVRMNTEKNEDEILDYLNRYLPDDICVTDVHEASDRFHARYNAVGKTYRYTCYTGKLKPVFDRKYVWVLNQEPDIEDMRKAAAFMIGTHDFAGFCGNPRMKKSTIRTVDRIDIEKNGPYLSFTYHGNGFLQYMVRIITGTLIETGLGRRTPESMPELIAAKDRRLAAPTAPACGLCLMKVDY